MSTSNPNPNTIHNQSSSSSPKQEHNNPGGEAAQNSGKESAITCPKVISRWKKALYNPEFKKLKGDSNPTTSAPATRSSTKAQDLINFIQADIDHITEAAKGLKKYEKRLSQEVGKIQSRFTELKSFEEGKKDEKDEQMNEFRRNLMKLKLTIPSKYNIGSEEDGYDKYFKFIKEGAKKGDESEKMMPQLHHTPALETSTEFKDFESRYTELGDRSKKLCLLCFAIFPQDAIIKRRLMLQWWVVEGFARKDNADKADKEKADKDNADKADKDKAAKDNADKDNVDKDKADKDNADKADKDKAAKDNADKDNVDKDKAAKDNAASIFEELMAKGFIEPVNDNGSPSIGSCRVHPFHHSALVALAEREKMFNFKSGGDPTQNFSDCFQACLMGEGLISHKDFEDFWEQYYRNKDEEAPAAIRDLIKRLENLHMLMNVDEHIIEFIEEWFSMMKNLNILYLGRWKASAIHHIEVEDSKFLKKLGGLRYVKLLSLQGVSNIISLPDSVLELTCLDVLDLRACSGLESIPEGIGSLESLTHLDMSECYLLAHMPKSLSRLKKLKVLKGFFVTTDTDSKNTSKNTSRNCCTLGDLKELGHLEKLCIYTDSMSFPEGSNLKDLEELKSVTKLTITWGVGRAKPSKSESESESASASAKPSTSASALASASAKPSKSESASASASEGRLPPELKKLDLKCFRKPEGKEAKVTPDWLKPKNLESLEKLYIRGGKFTDLGQFQGIDGEKKKTWKTVEVLRLKYLSDIEMEWKQLHDLFPKLEYLEKVSCPKLTLFPCDAKGVWIKPH